MKHTLFSKKFIVAALVCLTVSFVMFPSCDEENSNSQPAIPQTSRQANTISESSRPADTISESSSSTSSEAVSQPESIPEYIDTLFDKDTFIKYCNASEEPNYESVYKFDKNGAMTYSYNMFEGFRQATEKYFIRKFKSGIYQIFTYCDAKESAQILFTVYNNKEISADATASFIGEKEFNEIYNFHKEWNKQAAEREEE